MIWSLLACTPKLELPPQPWAAEASPPGDEVLVLPVLDRTRTIPVDYAESIGVRVPFEREDTRRRRTVELADVPRAFGWALPGEVGADLGDRWEGRFLVGRWPSGARGRLEQALGGSGLDVALSDLADSRRPVLVTWVSALDGRPISGEALPGEVVDTEVGPVVSDLFSEPYRVEATLGAALIAPDGEVVVRVDDDFEAVLSDVSGPDQVGRALASALAEDVAKLWPVEPSFRVRDASDDVAWVTPGL